MADLGQRVLILSLSSKDSESSQKILSQAGISFEICKNTNELCKQIEKGCGCILVAKEVLDYSTVERINYTTSSEGKWSFIPIIVLLGGGDLSSDNPEALNLLKPLRNTTLLERPVRVNTFISVIHTAISDRKRQYDVRDLLEELEKSKAVAIAANNAKSDFLANMSHEIRTPLGAILGFSELLLESKISPNEKWNYLNTMKRNGQLLSSIISDVLDLSKVESGKIDVEYLDVSLPELISEITTAHEPNAAKKFISIDVKFHDDVPSLIRTDPVRFKQVISNVVGNAIKFTDQGNIEIEITTQSVENKKLLIVEITDTGIGMNAEQVERLFRPFTQADSSITRKYGGTGLGLTLSKKLAQVLGGDLTLLTSASNQGSKFEISIDITEPVESAEPFHTVEEDNINLHGCHVLLVDDSKDNQVLISHLIKLSGATVETANDGLEGIEKAGSNHFDVVLMDIQMPRLGGYEAIKRLRKGDYLKPIIALTAHALKEDIDRCFEAGCDYYLTKPIHRGKLIHTISRCFSDNADKITRDEKVHVTVT